MTEAGCLGAGIKQHSKPNEKLKKGLEALGVHCGEIPRNCSRGHTCGHCCFGCPSGDKQDATGTYLADAAAAGATIFTGYPQKRPNGVRQLYASPILPLQPQYIFLSAMPISLGVHAGFGKCWRTP